ncbi:MFS transporter [Janthinobacterium agaricidamnosum]|nr:MFS transporter [Janthinobacterium agaricidamnosum]
MSRVPLHPAAHPPAAAQKWLILAIISSALLLIVIDMTVLYTALPRLTHDLGASASAKLWIVNAYPLVVSGLLPGFGTLGDKLGHKRLFIGGLAVFGIASLGAAYAPTAGLLIVARGFLAVGAAMMMPATLSIIRITFTDERERALAIGVWASVASGGAAFGPVLGGFLLEHFWWGSVFLINVPIVLLALVLGLIHMPYHPGQPQRRWDLLGSLHIMVGLIGITYAIKELSKRQPSPEAALVALLAGLLFMVLFVRRQRRRPDPLIDFRIFRERRFASAVGAALIAAAALVGMELVLSQRLQLVLDMSPLQAGLFFLPIPLASFVAGPLTGLLIPRIGSARVLWGSLLISGVGMGAYLLAYQSGNLMQMASLTVQGFGLGAAMTAASSAIMQNAPPGQEGMAASIEEVSFELGGAIGVTVLGSIMSGVYTASMTIPSAVHVTPLVRDSLDEALLAAAQLAPQAAAVLVTLGKTAFDHAFVAVLASATSILLLAALAVRLWSGAGGPATTRQSIPASGAVEQT